MVNIKVPAATGLLRGIRKLFPPMHLFAYDCFPVSSAAESNRDPSASRFGCLKERTGLRRAIFGGEVVRSDSQVELKPIRFH